MTTIQQYRRRVDELKAERRVLAGQLVRDEASLVQQQTRADALVKAQAMIQQAALQTQERLKVHLTAIVTTALRTVFQDKDMEFRLTLDSKRGRSECLLEVGDRGVFTDPLESHGGGVVDVVSFALRMSFWTINRTRPAMVLDEPFKFLSSDLMPLAAEVLQSISEKLGIQVIMVTHHPALIEAADKVFQVESEGGVSSVWQERPIRRLSISPQKKNSKG